MSLRLAHGVALSTLFTSAAAYAGSYGEESMFFYLAPFAAVGLLVGGCIAIARHFLSERQRDPLFMVALVAGIAAFFSIQGREWGLVFFYPRMLLLLGLVFLAEVLAYVTVKWCLQRVGKKG